MDPLAMLQDFGGASFNLVDVIRVNTSPEAVVSAVEFPWRIPKEPRVLG
jgi:hypothetical protein